MAWLVGSIGYGCGDDVNCMLTVWFTFRWGIRAGCSRGIIIKFPVEVTEIIILVCNLFNCNLNGSRGHSAMQWATIPEDGVLITTVVLVRLVAVVVLWEI